jgi:hypothetical protein
MPLDPGLDDVGDEGPGPDGVPPLILKSCASGLSLPLCLFFNRSLAFFLISGSSRFVTPIFKIGERNDVSNYRGIAILTTVGKLFELLVFRTHVRGPERSAGGLRQHGYVKGRSTVSNLLEYFYFVLKSIENGCQVDLIYTDFS